MVLAVLLRVLILMFWVAGFPPERRSHARATALGCVTTVCDDILAAIQGRPITKINSQSDGGIAAYDAIDIGQTGTRVIDTPATLHKLHGTVSVAAERIAAEIQRTRAAGCGDDVVASGQRQRKIQGLGIGGEISHTAARNRRLVRGFDTVCQHNATTISSTDRRQRKDSSAGIKT